MKKVIKIQLLLTILIILLFSSNISVFADEILTLSDDSLKTATDVISTNSDTILIMNASNKNEFSKSLIEGLHLSLDDKLSSYKILNNTTLGFSDEDMITHINDLINNNVVKLIICLDEASTLFFSQHGSSLFGNIPILFAYEGDSAIAASKNMGGFYIPYKLDSFLNAVLSLHPKTTEINFLINTALVDTYFHKKIIEYIDNNKSNDMKYNIIMTGQSEDIFPKLSVENSLNMIYSSIRYKQTPDDPGRFLAPYGSMQKLSRTTDNPTYGAFKGYGTRFNVGSYLYDGFKNGYALGNQAFDILSNKTSINEIGVKEAPSSSNLFINEQLQSYYNIPDNMSNTIYYNLGNTESTYVTNKIKTLTFISYTAICLLFALIIRAYFKRKSLKEEKKLDSIKTNFIANVSHELRTPLNIIISTIQLFELEYNFSRQR